MESVNLNDEIFLVDEDVARWMKWANALILKGKSLWEAQNHYFKYHNNLPQCKALEKEFDELLAGKVKVKPEEVQAELFR